MVDIFTKDLGIVTAMADHLGLETPLSRAALERFVRAARAGYGRHDSAAVFLAYAGGTEGEDPD